ncbi:hypothetical protein EJ03DRAFT_329762 [Teratosphaeria nubilosa]|uniref:Myb-like domain-containing protein n=1 Tax=Teratosphaeria nubilosa TaxID=161662 RepID=A0A6G1L1E2_9PEZI|nr:hypothetical protein EJ03DRAFT_329762 [Teratosphaeria nubilosa]
MASPSKEPTPANSSAAASDSKPAIAFTEKEEKVLKVAWSCLKSGPPEIDMKKLAAAAGFNTEKTCSNTWGVIKKKLAQLTPPAEDGEEAGKTPTKPKATPKKRSKKAADGDDDEAATGESPAKKPRKSPKKKVVKAEEDAAKGEDEDDVKTSIEADNE